MRRCVLVACLLATAGIVGVRADEPVASAAATDAPVAAVAVASSALDADDAALMELGIDLAHRVEPAADHITGPRPSDHEEATIAKFPMLHEIKGAEAKDWSDIQSLLFREPPAAGEETTDMKLDELEKKFEAIDARPVPSSIAPKGSNKLMPSLKKPELGLRGTLPKALQPRLQQKPNDEKNAKKKDEKNANKQDEKKAEAKAPTADAKKPAAKSAAETKGKTKAKAKSKAKGKGKNDAALAARASETVATVHEIEARLNGLRGAMARLKQQMHIKGAAAADATKRIEATLSKHRKEKKDLQERMAAHKARFAVLGDEATEAEAGEDLNFAETEAGADATADAESEAAIATEAELAAEVDESLSTDADADADAEAEAESESKAESELSEDAEAVDEILDTLM